jgi:hypothetical protein
MPTELEQLAMFEAWLSTQPTATPVITVEQAGGAEGDTRYMSPSTSLAWKAWQAALQAQQPGAQAVACFETWLDRDWPLWRNDPSHPSVARCRRAWEAAALLPDPPSLSEGAQAVLFAPADWEEELHSDGDVLVGRAFEKFVVPLYTHPQPPSIPEPSEADVEAAAIDLWHRFAPDDHIKWGEETHRAEYRDSAKSLLTTDRARLRERIGQAPGGDGDA